MTRADLEALRARLRRALLFATIVGDQLTAADSMHREGRSPLLDDGFDLGTIPLDAAVAEIEAHIAIVDEALDDLEAAEHADPLLDDLEARDPLLDEGPFAAGSSVAIPFGFAAYLGREDDTDGGEE